VESGTKLKQLRKEKDMTQQQIADLLKVGRPTVAGYETKGKQPDYDKLKILSKYFDVSIDYLLGNTDQRNISIDEKYKEVYDVEEAMEVILSQPGLMLNGELLSDESKIILANSILNGIRTVKELESKKNKQNKKSDDNEQRN